MARPVWRGSVSFGLVNIPVELYPGEVRADVSFHLVDSRNAARVKYERVNAETGEEVPWDKIVKGYEYSDGNYVLLSDAELERASVAMTKTIEIEQFIDASAIDVRHFERPYLIVPSQGGEKGYVLLREAARREGMAGIATIVVRARQHLAALLVQDETLILELLRYPQELRGHEEYAIPGRDLRKLKVTEKEIDLAAQLIKGMTAKWRPDAYHDEYRDALMKLIERKIKSGKTEVIEDVAEDNHATEPQTINFMNVLKQSVAKAARGRNASRRTSPRKKATPKKKPASRKRVAKRKQAS